MFITIMQSYITRASTNKCLLEHQGYEYFKLHSLSLEDNQYWQVVIIIIYYFSTPVFDIYTMHISTLR